VCRSVDSVCSSGRFPGKKKRENSTNAQRVKKLGEKVILVFFWQFKRKGKRKLKKNKSTKVLEEIHSEKWKKILSFCVQDA